MDDFYAARTDNIPALPWPNIAPPFIFGYDVVRHFSPDGDVSTGERTINEEQAAIVRRIFENYASGISPRAIATALNKEGIAGPRRAGWGASTIYGNWRRGTGILNNELYVGKLVWNRQRFIKDPQTGKRQARMNPPEEWIIEDVPDLRIVPQDLWSRVKDRQKATRSTMISDSINRPERAHRAKHLFSGLLTCGACGGGYIQVGKHYYGCSAKRNKGTCDNTLTIKRTELENRVLSGLKDQLLHPDLIAEFVTAYQAEFNRLSAEVTKSKAKTERELAKVTKQIDKIVEAIAEGMFHPSMKAKMDDLETRKAELVDELANVDAEPPILLHPGLADLYKEKVAELSAALNDPSTKVEATNIIRSLLSEIRLIPEDGSLSIELAGELAGLLSLGGSRNAQSRPVAACSRTVVAGVGFEPTTFRL